MRETRPTSEHPIVRSMAVSRVLQSFVQYAGEDGGGPAEIRTELEEALKYSDGDGARLAARLKSWFIDDTLVDLCRDLATAHSDVHREVIEQWVRASGIAPRFQVGDKVRVWRHYSTLNKSEDAALGEIAKLDDQMARYVVYVEAWGHVRKGSGTNGALFAYEVVEKWNPTT